MPTLHPGQAKLIAEAKRFNAAACGRRFGKTKFGALRLAAPYAIKGLNVGWFAPNYKYLEEPWNEIRKVLQPIILRTNKTERVISLRTGGQIDFWTLEDEDAGRSRRYHLVIVDEAGLVKNLEKRWNEAIRPTLIDFRGSAWFLGTPKGQNYFATAFALGQDPLETEWASWRMPTSANTKIPNLETEIEAARKGMPDRAFRQEILAEFLEEAGGVFRRVKESVNVGRKSNGPKEPGRSYVLGVDLARIKDFTVLSVVDELGKQVFFERFNQISWERQIARIVTVANTYNAVVYLDSTGIGDPIFERLRATGIKVNGYVLTNSSKEQLINNLAMLLEQKSLSLMDIPEQTAELQVYQYELTNARNVRMNAPPGMHDDTVIALALSAWPLKMRRQQPPLTAKTGAWI